jgi:hypothetical protein
VDYSKKEAQKYGLVEDMLIEDMLMPGGSARNFAG